jgi:hypothetical protein
MKKLTLNIDKLQVETFATDEASNQRGTVEGASLPTRPLCQTLPPLYTETCTLEVCC